MFLNLMQEVNDPETDIHVEFPCVLINLSCVFQEKLSKSIHYLISKEEQVRVQISELEVLIHQTEVNHLPNLSPVFRNTD